MEDISVVARKCCHLANVSASSGNNCFSRTFLPSLYDVLNNRLNDYDDDNNTHNKDQSSLAKRGIAVTSPPNSSFIFARWQHRTDGLATICNCMFWLGVRPAKSPLPLGVTRGQGPHLTQCVIGPGPYQCTRQMTSKSVERFRQVARMCR